MTRLRARLDHLIAPFVKRGLESVDTVVLEVLRLGAYQVVYMGGVPGYAAVSASVDQARAEGGPRPGGFVNAVLRKVLAAGDGSESYPDEVRDPEAFFSTWGSHPAWLVRRWLERWPPSDVRLLIEADNRPPPTYVTPLEVLPAEAVTVLGGAGIGASDLGEGTRCLRLQERGDVVRALRALPASVVQDPAANLVSRYSDVPSGTMVADLCAAPGGKALALSGRPAEILAVDRSESRIRMVRENARRTGRSLALVVADALHPPLERADVVLLDVPCSGTGTLARHPDARWRLRPDSIREMARLQSQMLQSAAPIVAPGGLLIYSTCSLEAEENQGQVTAFLEGNPDFRLEPTDAVPPEYLDSSGCLEVTPQRFGFDGAYAARMRRAG